MPTISTDSIVKQNLDNLNELYAKLDAIDTSSMDVAEQRRWFTEYSTTRHAIITLETANIRALNAKEQAQANQVTQAIDQCESDLHGIQDSEAVIGAVGSVLGSIASLVTLFA